MDDLQGGVTILYSNAKLNAQNICPKPKEESSKKSKITQVKNFKGLLRDSAISGWTFVFYMYMKYNHLANT